MTDLQDSMKEFRNQLPEEILRVGKTARKRTLLDKDSVIAIGGYEGDGKSTLGNSVCMATDPDFDLDKNVLYSPKRKELKDKILSTKRYSAILGDEAIKILYKLNWASKSQIYINMLYSLCRKENKTTVLCIPRFTDLNEYFRNHRVLVWIQIIETGHAVLFMKDWSPFAKDPWWIQENQKIIDKSRGSKKLVHFNINDKLKILQKSKNFVTSFQFPKLPEPIWNEYARLRDAVKYTGIEEEIMQMGMREKRQLEEIKILANHIHETEKMPLTTIGKMTGMTQQRYSKLLKEGVPISFLE